MVVSGDTLFSLAQYYGSTVDDFRRFNQLVSDLLTVGQQLFVPVANCSPGPFICTAADKMSVHSATGYVQCGQINTNRLDKHALLSGGMIMALQVRGFVNAGTEVCFADPGKLVFIDSTTSPPTVYELADYAVNGETCGQIDRPGTIVLLQPGGADDAFSATPLAALPEFDPAVALDDCQVTTMQVLRFRDSPDGETVLSMIPFNVTLDAMEKRANWYQVSYLDTVGWIDADFVETAGQCG